MAKVKLGARPLQIIGLLVSVIAGGLVFLIALTTNQDQAPETRPIVVAVQEIPQSTKLTEENIALLLRVVPINIEAAPPAAFGALAEVPRGAVVTLPVAKGAPLIKDQLNRVVTNTNQNGLSTNLNLKEGMVAISVNAGEVGTLAAGVQPLDRVDIAVSYKVKQNAEEPRVTTPTTPAGGAAGQPRASEKQYTKLLLQNVLVLNVGSNYVPDPKAKAGSAPPPAALTVVTLALKREDAVLLKFLRDEGAIIDLLLRPVGDNNEPAVPSMTIEAAIERMR